MKKFILFLMAMVFLFAGCTMQPVKDTARFEIFGENIGVYMKAEHPRSVAKTLDEVKEFEAMTNADLIAADVFGAAYKYAIENHPEDRNLALLVKSGVDLLGLRLDISNLNTEQTAAYTKNIRAVITGYLRGVM